MQAVRTATREHPDTRTFIYDGAPSAMHSWGILGALRIATGNTEVHLTSIQDKNMQRELASGSVAILSWDSTSKQLSVAARDPVRPMPRTSG